MISTNNATLASENGPFGDSDAANVDFTVLKKGLINFADEDHNNSIDDPFQITPTTRVIFGKKGAGKTLYLKLIQDYCRQNNGDKTGAIYVTQIDNMPPDSRIIIKVTNWLDEHKDMANETWRKIWYRAILRTIYCHVFNNKEFDKYITKKNLKVSYVKKYERIIPSNSVPISIFRQLENILTRFNSLRDLNAFLELEEWADFEAEIGELLSDLPPLYFFIDAIDDDYQNAPHHWLRCQFGLFNCIFRMLRSQTIGTRLHVVVCLREFVYSYILQTTHGSRYLGESRIKLLKWDKKTLAIFFEKKIAQLDDRFFLNPDKEKKIKNFVGTKEIFNLRHEQYEDIYQYIFRHTMLMPRDIINIGNLYCDKLLNRGNNNDLQLLLKESVHEVAKQIASEQLMSAALLINTRWIYKGAIEQDNIDSYTSPDILAITKENLKNLIKSINTDRFTLEELNEKNDAGTQFGFNKADAPFTALYHSGLLGYVSQDQDGKKIVSSFSGLRSSEFNLPMTASEYVFHSCLIDLLQIKPVGEPVVFT
ncbi:P-loop ATPase, Sll1717 family [Flavobacterium sp.]|uniref:P-loop ATPase, Sll1717 family n=1 Tax=Flavobacterium sp. TaxID=239 RepID=UPI0039E4F877